MFKALSALFLCLSLITNASAQSVSAEGCMTLGGIFYGVVQEKLEGKPLKAQLTEMRDALKGTENEAMIPFFEAKIVEAYQTKKSAQVFGQEFVNQCFDAHGDLSKLTGKKV